MVQLARLGGYLARASDPPPGNTVIWRNMARLTDIELGFSLGGSQLWVKARWAGRLQNNEMDAP